jgi:hypothetical protein
VLTAVPEPATWTLSVITSAVAGYYWHRRRKQHEAAMDEIKFGK